MICCDHEFKHSNTDHFTLAFYMYEVTRSYTMYTCTQSLYHIPKILLWGNYQCQDIHILAKIINWLMNTLKCKYEHYFVESKCFKKQNVPFHQELCGVQIKTWGPLEPLLHWTLQPETRPDAWPQSSGGTAHAWIPNTQDVPVTTVKR